MDKLTVDDFAEFTWGFGRVFHLSTNKGDFEWSDPDYGGDNVIVPTLPYSQWCNKEGIEFGRDKGEYRIGDYCGEDVIIRNG